MIIDGDGHVAEPMTVWTDYLEKEFYPRFHHYRSPTGIETLVVEEHVYAHAVSGSPYLPSPDRAELSFSIGDSMTPRGILPGNARNRRFDEGHPGGSQADARLKVHDDEGVDAAVLFTTLGLNVGSLCDPRVAVAVCRALNGWLADFCAAAPKELFGVATLPTQDPDAAAAELRRCVETSGFVAGNDSTEPRHGRNPDRRAAARSALGRGTGSERTDLPAQRIERLAALPRPRSREDQGGLAHHGSRVRADGRLRRAV
jgi:uncharacterized protein